MPYWSLCYEVWYYIIFGVFFFTQGYKRVLVTLAAALIAGPAILALFPIWCMGAWLAKRLQSLPRAKTTLAGILFCITFCIVIAIDGWGVDLAIQRQLYESIPGFWRLAGSQRFITDHIIGACVALNLWAFLSLPNVLHKALVHIRPTLVSLAGFSFTLYLVHRPLTLLLGKLLPSSLRANPFVAVAMACLVLLVCWAASWLTERQLPRWRRGIARLLSPRHALAGGRKDA